MHFNWLLSTFIYNSLQHSSLLQAVRIRKVPLHGNVQSTSSETLNLCSFSCIKELLVPLLLSVFGKLDPELLCLGRWDSSTRQNGPLSKPPGCHSGRLSAVFSQCVLFLTQATVFKLHLCPALKTLQDSQLFSLTRTEYDSRQLATLVDTGRSPRSYWIMGLLVKAQSVTVLSLCTDCFKNKFR